MCKGDSLVVICHKATFVTHFFSVYRLFKTVWVCGQFGFSLVYCMAVNYYSGATCGVGHIIHVGVTMDNGTGPECGLTWHVSTSKAVKNIHREKGIPHVDSRSWNLILWISVSINNIYILEQLFIYIFILSIISILYEAPENNLLVEINCVIINVCCLVGLSG